MRRGVLFKIFLTSTFYKKFGKFRDNYRNNFLSPYYVVTTAEAWST